MKIRTCLQNFTVLVGLSLLQTGCLQGSSGAGSSPIEQSTSSLNQTTELSKLNFKATSQVDTTLESSTEQVVVQIKELEVLIAGAQKAAKVVLKKDLGSIDLMKLNQGVLFDLFSLNISEGTQIKEMRLRLKDSGHYYINSQGEQCELKTPSAQQSGLKFKLPKGMKIEAGYTYNVVMGFDPKKSVVVTGNGGCLLKPVIRIESISRSAVVDEDDSAGEEQLPVDDGEEQEEPPPVDDPEDNSSTDGPVEGIDYIIDGDLIYIPQEDGSYLVIEGVDLTQVSIEDVLASIGLMN